MKYVLIAIFFCSCNGLQFTDPPPVSTERLDTILSKPTGILAEPVLFESAFIKGTTLSKRNESVNFYGVTIGNIKIESGRIIACDPLHIDEYGKPFTQAFPTGVFPVQLSIAQFEDEETVAFARINFSEEPVVRWQFALLEGQNPIPLGGEKKHGYSVDGGIGIFIDEEANKSLDFKAVSDMNGAVYKEMDKHYRNDWKYAIYKFGNQNLAAFTSGEGDGYYASYIGFGTSGKPCRLVTDFGLFDWKLIK